ncbi:arsenic resistance protein [Neisseria yangbaofengii]|uniref:arsenic resistance protein n=1 Tax=Neisseria yangbaofengii TaxID=2709396 RepID=UPI003FCDB9C8
MGIFERFLSIWVLLAIAAGVIIGTIFPQTIQYIALMEMAHINLPVAVLIWLMIYPMMIQIDWSAIKDAGQKPKGLMMTVVVNWLVKPFTMALIGWLFFRGLFAPWIDPQSAQEYIAGIILLGAAPCTAMVFVWSQLVKGDPNYTLVQVSVNDIIMIFAFAPIARFLLGVSDISIPWQTLVYSMILYVLLPLLAGLSTRKILLNKSLPVGLVYGQAQAFFYLRLIADRGVIVRFSGANHFKPAIYHCADCHSFVGTNLRHFLSRLLGSQTPEFTA